MQRILSLLVFGTGPLPDVLIRVSPWIDCRYVVVGRDSRDVFMSMWNHYRSYTDVMYAVTAAGDPPGGPLPRCPDDIRWLWSQWLTRASFEWEPDGWPFWSHHYHAAAWWEFRDLENVLLVHYNDLLADLEAEMRRVAAHVGIAVAEESWPALVDAARFESMKREGARLLGPMERFAGGADTFLYKGSNGRWRDVLTEEDLRLYDKAAGSLDPGLRVWLEAGGRPPVGGGG